MHRYFGTLRKRVLRPYRPSLYPFYPAVNGVRSDGGLVVRKAVQPMKHRGLLTATTAVLVAVGVLTLCGTPANAELGAVKFTVTPERLSYPGGDVTLTITTKDAVECDFFSEPPIDQSNPSWNLNANTGQSSLRVFSTTSTAADGTQTWQTTVTLPPSKTKGVTYTFHGGCTDNPNTSLKYTEDGKARVGTVPRPDMKEFYPTPSEIDCNGDSVTLWAEVVNAKTVKFIPDGSTYTVPVGKPGEPQVVQGPTISIPANPGPRDRQWTFKLWVYGFEDPQSSPVIHTVHRTQAPCD